MPKKAHIEHITVKEGDKEKDIVIAMTAKEGEDRSYREYIKEAEIEKTREELRNLPPTNPEKKKKAREDMAGELKEYQEWKSRRDGVRKY